MLFSFLSFYHYFYERSLAQIILHYQAHSKGMRKKKNGERKLAFRPPSVFFRA